MIIIRLNHIIVVLAMILLFALIFNLPEFITQVVAILLFAFIAMAYVLAERAKEYG
jgi:energy-coupling factor transporter transmembrane protein EcfT